MPSKQVYWYTLADSREQIEPLRGNLSCDVVIVGAGMAGLMAAQKLSEAGKSVIVLEADYAGAGASGKSSGFITPDSELELSDLFDRFGAEHAKSLWEFAKSGVEAIRSNIEQHNFECDYLEQDSLFIAKSEDGFKKVQHEHEVQRQLGYESVLYDAHSVEEVIGSRGYYGAIRYGNTFGITSFLYCRQLKQLLQKQGVKIFEGTTVEKIETGKAICRSGTAAAKQIIVCSDWWLDQLVEEGREVYHAQTFLGVTRPLPEDFVNYMFPQGKMMVWDTELIYQYYRVVGDNRLLVGGSNLLYTYEPRAAVNTGIVTRKLHRYIHLNFPKLRDVEFEYLWPGLIGVSKDFLPVGGESSRMKNVYYVGGSAGLPWAAAMGRYIAEKILHHRSDMDSYFSATRKFILGPAFQAVARKPITFALAHGYEKFAK